MRPSPGDCVTCGCTPAAPAVFRRHSGYLVLSRTWTERATYCRTCAAAAYRRCQAWNLTRGWWGLVSMLVNVAALLGNAWQMRALAATPRGSRPA